MIGRGTLLLDRTATLVLALLLIAGGAAGGWWWSGRGPLSATTHTARLGDVVDHAWWPWASAAVGLLLVVLGLRWIFAHLRSTSVKHLYLDGSGEEGRLDADAAKVAGAAARAYAETPGVRDARGTVRRARGQLVATLTATVEPDADLGRLAQGADRVSAELAQVLGRDDLYCGVELRVARRARPQHQLPARTSPRT